jgi:hypothetical protein
MDEEFFEVFGAIGLGEFWDFSECPSSKLLTLEFMSMVKKLKLPFIFIYVVMNLILNGNNFLHVLALLTIQPILS